jgi:acyl-coenzyme A thioesterase PaaI-like protein
MSTDPPIPRVLRLHQTVDKLPLGIGKRVFTEVFKRVAPYFQTIPATVASVEPGRVLVDMRDTRAVHNHLGTIHAIALCNLAELAMGVTAEVTIPVTHRWIPKTMQVEYLAKAKGTVAAEAILDLPSPLGDKQDLPVKIVVHDRAGKAVFSAVIGIYVTKKPT